MDPIDFLPTKTAETILKAVGQSGTDKAFLPVLGKLSPALSPEYPA
jgi:hypothetical protein